MYNFIKYLFFAFCGFLTNAFVFMTFGALVAFFTLSLTSAKIPVVKESSPVLADFFDSPQKSKIFSFRELNEGVAHLIFKCAREDSINFKRPVTMPVAPTFQRNGKYLEVCVPFSANIFGRNITMGAFVSMLIDDGVNVSFAKIGKARLPDFVARKIAKSLYGFYTPIKSLKKYCDILETSDVEVLSNGTVRIEK